ncbi:MAG TPA: hypothetical protein VFJ78_09125 [Gaiellaceae bacterium]|nr:hypothetical protein [Gaiellaceae bacterium]
MRKSIRAALFLCAVLSTLAFASSAFASFSPRLVIGGGAGPTRIGVMVANADDPTAKVSIYIPSAYQVGTPAPGKLGDVTATAAAADLGGAVLPLTGELDAIAPTAATTAAATQCGVTPAQTWNLALTAAGQTLNIPMFVVAGAAPEVASGYQWKLVVCLPPPDVPAGTPGRATFGAKLLSATFASSAITAPSAAGDYRWTSLWTPYNPGKGTPNAAGSVESQALNHAPAQVKLTIVKKKVTTYKKVNGTKRKIVKTTVKFSVSATENGAAPASVKITTTAAGKKFGASGSFVLAAGKSATVVATAVLDSDSGSVPTGQPANAAADLFFHDLGAAACVKTAIFQGLPCLDAATGGVTLKATTTVKGYK